MVYRWRTLPRLFSLYLRALADHANLTKLCSGIHLNIQVNALMGELDAAISAVEQLESCLDHYDSVSREDFLF